MQGYPRGWRGLFAKQLVSVKGSEGSNPSPCAKEGYKVALYPFFSYNKPDN